MELDHEQIVSLLCGEPERVALIDLSALENAQAKKLLEQAVVLLTPPQREVIMLRYYDDLTLKQCGERLGLTQEQVRAIEEKALRELRTQQWRSRSLFPLLET